MHKIQNIQNHMFVWKVRNIQKILNMHFQCVQIWVCLMSWLLMILVAGSYEACYIILIDTKWLFWNKHWLNTSNAQVLQSMWGLQANTDSSLNRRPPKSAYVSCPELKPSSFDRSRHGEDDGDNEKSPNPPKDRLYKSIFIKTKKKN